MGGHDFDMCSIPVPNHSPQPQLLLHPQFPYTRPGSITMALSLDSFSLGKGLNFSFRSSLILVIKLFFLRQRGSASEGETNASEQEAPGDVTLGTSRLDCGISFGQLVQERDVSWIEKGRKVMGRELGKRGLERIGERRRCFVHHRESGSARKVSRTQSGTGSCLGGKITVRARHLNVSLTIPSGQQHLER